MRTRQSVVTLLAALLCAMLVSTSTSASTNTFDRYGHECLPGISTAFFRTPVYARLYAVLREHQTSFKTLLDEVDDQASYVALLARAASVASSIPDGRVVVTLPDGTVVVDTARPDDPGNSLPSGNSYDHFVSKTVNENHNSRVAIFSAQQYPCGVGIESKLSTTTGSSEVYVALRLGRHLNSAGTARLSIVQ